MDEAERCNRIVYLANGRIVVQGGADAVSRDSGLITYEATGANVDDAARSLRDDGTLPPLVDDPGIGTAIRSGDLIAPEDQPWLEAYEQTLRHALHPGVLLAAE